MAIDFLSPDVAYERITQILGCKWSVRILEGLADGVSRPSELLKGNDGLASRVLHRCLNRLERDGLIQRKAYAEVPPRVEYAMTPQGKKFYRLLTSVRSLSENWNGIQKPVRI